MNQDAKKIAQLLKLLANEHRLLILCALKDCGHTVNDIHEAVPNITLSALSQHLNQLKLAEVLESEKNGMNVVYRIKDKKVTALLGIIKEYYCS